MGVKKQALFRYLDDNVGIDFGGYEWNHLGIEGEKWLLQFLSKFYPVLKVKLQLKFKAVKSLNGLSVLAANVQLYQSVPWDCFQSVIYF